MYGTRVLVTHNTDTPNEALGITQDVLDKMFQAAERRPYIRDGTVLSNRWRLIQTAFTKARKAYTKSGQQNGQAFTDFLFDSSSNESKVSIWCAASFHGKPSLQVAVKAIPADRAAEEGVDGGDKVSARPKAGYGGAEEAGNKSRKRVRGGDSASEMNVSILQPLAHVMSQPIRIQYDESSKRHCSPKSTRRKAENEKSRDYASTVKALLDLEKMLKAGLTEAETDLTAEDEVHFLQGLKVVRRRIDRAEDFEEADADDNSE
jgi:hypothetical protein